MQIDMAIATSALLLVSQSESPGSQAGVWQRGVLIYLTLGLQALAAPCMQHPVLAAMTKTWVCGVYEKHLL